MLSFKVKEEEGLVFSVIEVRNPDRATNRSSIHLAIEILVGFRFAGRGVDLLEEVSGIQHAVAIEHVGVAVEAVGARLGNHVDDVAAAPPVLSGESIGLNLELLHVVGRWDVDHATPVGRGIPGAVQKEGLGSEEGSAEVEEGNVLVGNAVDSVATHHLIFRAIVN